LDTESLIKISASVFALAIAIIGHEIMHGYSAYKYGDTTAKNAGRLSLNPLVHVDPVGTVIVPLLLFISGAPFLFGWAKPVPINTHTVINNGGYNAAVVVSLAGIAFNFTCAILASIVLGVMSVSSVFDFVIATFFVQLLLYSVVLGVFNLWPIPPLDGSHAISYFMMNFGNFKLYEWFNKVGNYGMILIIAILATPLNEIFFAPVGFIIKLLIS